MSGLIWVESFEAYLVGGGESFAQHLSRLGLTYSGTPEAKPDRSTFGVAADVSHSTLSYPITTGAPVVSFGFAVLVSEAGSVWRAHPDIEVALLPEPELNGVSGDGLLAYGRWAYIEVVVDKIERTLSMRVNGAEAAGVPLPNSLRFVVDFEPRFIGGDSLTVDDLYVHEGTPLGPISIRRYPVSVPRGEALDAAGESVSGRVSGVSPESALALTVLALSRVSDVDGREVDVFVGSQSRRIHPKLSPTYERGIFDRSSGLPWSAEQINSSLYGLRIAR